MRRDGYKGYYRFHGYPTLEQLRAFAGDEQPCETDADSYARSEAAEGGQFECEDKADDGV